MLKQLETSMGCLDAAGFKAAGIHCDIRNKADNRLDLAVLWSDTPCTAAGVFTRNRMAAAPVQLCREALLSGSAFRGIVVNSGNANACTGKQGHEDAKRTQALAAEALGCTPEEVLVCSTGRIGEPLPMDRMGEGIRQAGKQLGDSEECSLRAADAILTSDTGRKVCSVEVDTPDGPVRVAGMAKGAGMIEPNMATMLAFICTDAAVASDDLQAVLSGCIGDTFNAITVDGDESTNDTVLMLANGAGKVAVSPAGPLWEAFRSAVHLVCGELARKIVSDGEKITKVVELCIEGASNADEAHAAARSVANSLLVKSSWYGNDPNWGRIMDALGYSGASLAEDTVRMWYETPERDSILPVFDRGTVFNGNKDGWKRIVSAKSFRIRLDLGQGSGASTVWSTDLTEGYVNFNKSE